LTKVIPSWLKIGKNGNSIEIDEPKAEIVRAIFDLSIEGMGTYSITRHLNEDLKRFPTVSSAPYWNDSYIAQILRNPAVYGNFQPKEKINGNRVAKGDLVQDYFPAIISKDKFNLTQSRIAGRTVGGAGRKGSTLSSLFSGLVKCSSCGGPVLMRSKGVPPKGFKYLRCENSLKNAGCRSPAWRYEEFESAFIQFVREVNFVDVFNGTDSSARTAVLEGQAATVRVNINKLTDAYLALISRFEDPELPANLVTAFTKRSVELEAEIKTENAIIEDIQNQIAELKVNNLDAEQEDFLTNYDKLFKKEDLAKLREIRFSMSGLLKRIVSEIVVTNDFTINPWEIEDILSDKFMAEMIESGVKTEKALESYFSKPHGIRRYAYSERYFLVKFRSGSSRVVHPYSGVTYMSVSERLAKMRKGR
jgi:hypothetical protein